MDDNTPGAGDTHDLRTREGTAPQEGVVGQPGTGSRAEDDLATFDLQAPVSAVNPRARPIYFSIGDIDTSDTSLDESLDRLIDPSLSGERMSTNPDVLDLDSAFIVAGEEPDFMEDLGTTDVIEAIEEAEPYFPPIDPPAATRRNLQNMDGMGGFSDTSLEEPEEVEGTPLRLQGNDEELAERVRYALAADSYTADLSIEVEVEYGVVYLRGKVRSLEDIDQAEQVAGSVPGVEEVEEDLEIV